MDIKGKILEIDKKNKYAIIELDTKKKIILQNPNLHYNQGDIVFLTRKDLILTLPIDGICKRVNQSTPVNNLKIYWKYFACLKTPSEVAKLVQPLILYPYTSKKIDVWDIIKEASQLENGKIQLIYSNYKINPGQRGNEAESGWNREHCWPKSRGNMFINKPGIGTDAHNLFCSDPSVNTSRSNKFFDYGGKKIVDKSPYLGYDGYLDVRSDKDSWEPPDYSKGIVSRAIFYMAAVYGKLGLKLVERVSKNQLEMGKLSVLLEWNSQFPPTEWEKKRNKIIKEYQGNTNPFIDFPGLANQINWSSKNYEIRKPLQVIDFDPYLTEIHYDNIGKDIYEGFEITIPLNYDINQVQVYLYNGSDGLYYKIIEGNQLLPGNVYLNQNIRLCYYFTSLQNGNGDGLAIINKSNHRIIQFISYEGVLEAKNGPCSGRSSKEIGVVQDGKTAIGNSLQLIGDPSDFNWKNCQNCNFGIINQ